MKKLFPKVMAFGLVAASLTTTTAFAAAPLDTTNDTLNQNAVAASDESVQPLYIWTDQYKCNGDGVNIRTGPGTEYESIGKLNKGDIVGVHRLKTGKDGKKWAKIDLGDWESGWVRADYLDFYASRP